MKKYILSIVILFSITISAQKTEEEKLKSLTVGLCNQLIHSHMDGDKNPREKFENRILKYLGISRETENYEQKIAEFWNENSDQFICDNDLDRASRQRQHILKRSVDFDYHSFIFQMWLMKYKNPKIDFNAIEIVSGEEETIIDYLDKILSGEMGSKDYTTSYVQSLRDILYKHFGARSASELKD